MCWKGTNEQGPLRWRKMAPTHETKVTLYWLHNNIPAFAPAEEWPSQSPNMSLMDYRLWPILEAMVCKNLHKKLDSFMPALVAATHVVLETLRATLAEWYQCSYPCERRPFLIKYVFFVSLKMC